jgi:glucose/arabinose dehydrogenase
MKLRSLVPLAVYLAIVGCGGGGGIPLPSPPPPPPPPCHSGLETPRAFANLAFSSPTAMLQAPNDTSRWFVVEQGGVVRTFQNDPDATASTEFVDISSRIHMEGEAGLLGMAFHPSFATNGLVYLNFTEQVGGELRSVTAEFESMDGGQTLDPATERDLLTVEKPATNNNGGNLAFGPDGLLYLGLGDGGNSDTAQDTHRLLGKLLRIDVNSRPFGAPYGIPSDNPFVGAPLCNFGGTGVLDCPEVYAIGFRNPWRWSFDSLSGDLWVGDVGHANWEEIDLVSRGGNYGWNVREGAHCFPPSTGCTTEGLTDPVAEYGHDVGFSITGGYVYRGGQQTQVAGNYVFGDFGGMIAWLEPATVDSFAVRQLVEEGCTPPGADGALAPSAFAQDLDGELYLLDYGTGQIRSLEFTE